MTENSRMCRDNMERNEESWQLAEYQCQSYMWMPG